ncbi:DUF997 family protein [uncultured Adlercreutzia sp.]|uniref:DUF997 family protein n=1 Tax=uncultured Adlercreutzia sp. TaxID=875803 RepID=UPI002675EDF7|nr:DUF997 family protein [uncultured Adlercreutzia sp.]
MGKRKFTTYAAKMRQANREAVATVAAVVIIAVTWLSWGIGLADSDIRVFSTPVWIIGGCIGTWLMAVLASLVLGCGVFANFSLDDDDEEPAPAAPAADAGVVRPGAAAPATPASPAAPAAGVPGRTAPTMTEEAFRG